MMDQANALRNLIRQRTQQSVAEKQTLNARVIAVTSGKGGVGKTNFSVNLAINMRKQQKRIVLIDADFGMANVEILFGITPKYNFGDVLTGSIPLEMAMTPGPMGVQFLSGGSGLTSMYNISEKQLSLLIDSFARLDDMADIILIDTGAGISPSVVNFIRASKEAIVMTTPDPTALTDAYSLIKTVKDTSTELPDFKLVVNRVDSPAEGLDVYNKLSRVCSQFLDIKLVSLGNIPNDNYLFKSVRRQEPVSILYPQSSSSRCIEAITMKLLSMPVVDLQKQGLKGFVMKIMGRMGGA